MKQIIYLLVAIVALSTQSCNEWLNVKPRMEIDREVLYSTESGFKGALTGCYTKLKRQTIYGKELTMTTIEHLAQQWTAQTDDEQALLDFDYANDAAKDKFKRMYADLYNTISQTNDLLFYLEKNRHVIKDEQTYNMIKGEAFAIRAFCHFDILRLFGELPVGGTEKVKLPYAEVASINNIPYYNFSDFIDKVITDYTNSEALLSESDPIVKYTYDELNDPVKMLANNNINSDFEAYRRVHFNLWAVKALKARAYLYKGDKTTAYTIAMEVINAKLNDNSVITLGGARDYANKAFTLPSETLFALHNFKLSQYSQELFSGPKSFSAAISLTVMREDVFGDNSSDNRFSLWLEQVTTTEIPRITTKKYWQSETGEEEAEDSDPTIMQLIPIIRLSEVYLIAIETAPTIAESNLLMKQYKTAKNVTHFDLDASTLKAEVLKEYRRELWAEGQMFYTYKRVGAKKMLWREKDVMETNYIIPIPDGELKY